MLERRYFTFSEIRASAESDLSPVISGHAAVFNQPSEEIFGIPGWREIIRPGAFAKAIKTDDVRALINHKDDLLIGRVSNRTLSLEEDEIGLKVRISPPNTSYANDLLALIRGKYMTQMSFGFIIGAEGERIDRANKLREILEVQRLFDVSPVTEPAYPQTDVQARSYFESKIRALDSENLTEEQKKAGFLGRMKARDDFISRRTPPPNLLSFAEIIKKARSQTSY